MPSWCMNHLTIAGPEDALDAFTERCRESAIRTSSEYLFTFETFLPTPESFHETERTGFVGRDEYGTWREAKAFFHSDGTVTFDDAGELSDVAERKYWVNRAGAVVVREPGVDSNQTRGYSSWWAVKWNASRVSWDRVDGETLEVEFLTPWGAPTRVIRAMQELIRPLGLVASLRSVTEGSSSVDLLLEDGSEATEDDVDVEDDDEAHDAYIV